MFWVMPNIYKTSGSCEYSQSAFKQTERKFVLILSLKVFEEFQFFFFDSFTTYYYAVAENDQNGWWYF